MDIAQRGFLPLQKDWTAILRPALDRNPAILKSTMDRLERMTWFPNAPLGNLNVHVDIDLSVGLIQGGYYRPAPDIEIGAPPRGLGLTKDPAGFPAGSVRTAGGYTIVPEGNTNWSIYGPDQKAGDTPVSRIWGDPHVSEADGGRWDFTKNSDFRLPDGTLINVQTSSETGQSVSTGLSIVNGHERIDVTGVNGQPSTGFVQSDGLEWAAQHMASNPARDTFVLGGSNKDVQWFRERAGSIEGMITGSTQDGQHTYDQVIDRNQKLWVDPGLRPPLGSSAWGQDLGNMIGSLLPFMPFGMGDLMNFLGGFVSGLQQPSGRAQQESQHDDGDLRGTQHWRTFPYYGGLGFTFPDFRSAYSSVGHLGDIMRESYMLQASLSTRLRMDRIA